MQLVRPKSTTSSGSAESSSTGFLTIPSLSRKKSVDKSGKPRSSSKSTLSGGDIVGDASDVSGSTTTTLNNGDNYHHHSSTSTNITNNTNGNTALQWNEKTALLSTLPPTHGGQQQQHRGTLISGWTSPPVHRLNSNNGNTGATTTTLSAFPATPKLTPDRYLALMNRFNLDSKIRDLLQSIIDGVIDAPGEKWASVVVYAFARVGGECLTVTDSVAFEHHVDHVFVEGSGTNIDEKQLCVDFHRKNNVYIELISILRFMEAYKPQAIPVVIAKQPFTKKMSWLRSVEGYYYKIIGNFAQLSPPK